MLRHNAVGFSPLNQKTLREFLQCVRELVASRLFLRPGADLVDPFPLIAAVKLASINPGIFDDCVNLANGLNPFLLDVGNLRDDFFMP